MKAHVAILASVCLGGVLAPAASPQEKPAPGRWETQNSGIEDSLLAVTFVNEKVGWAVGSADTILNTTDGGSTWKRQIDRDPKGPDFSSVLFTSPKEGWVATSVLGTIMHTIDAGETWRKVPLPHPQSFGSSFCKQAAVGSTYIFQYSNVIYITDDSGKTWKLVTEQFPNDSGKVGQMCFTDLKHGFAAWNATQYAVTDDGGKIWTEGKLKNEASGNHSHIQFVDAKTGWILPDTGTIHATVDGGATWQAQKLGKRIGTLVGVNFVDANLGHVLAGNTPSIKEGSKLLRTTDGGMTWEALPNLKAANAGYVHGLSFPSKSNGWVVGGKGFIFHYSETKAN
jgi:photosystem II stability/assembly factor-like uncharacterized protein